MQERSLDSREKGEKTILEQHRGKLLYFPVILCKARIDTVQVDITQAVERAGTDLL